MPRSRPTCCPASRSPHFRRSTRRRPFCSAPRRRRPPARDIAGPVVIFSVEQALRRVVARPSGPRIFGRARGSRARGPRSRHVSWAFRQGASTAVSPSSAPARRCRPVFYHNRTAHAGRRCNESRRAVAPTHSTFLRVIAATRAKTPDAPTATASRCGASAVPAHAARELHSGTVLELFRGVSAAPTPLYIAACRRACRGRRYTGRDTRRHRPATP
mmetsp:Transcript_8397/g.23789  ORF Transcript_8397/g.23789 Transcript_8397/m.23789 type:complete len:216 (+) Transcript_8397:1271-1918(+)